MSKKVILLSALFLLAGLYSCSPAAEDRQQMHERAKGFQDSIASVIRATIAEAEGPAAPPPPPPALDSSGAKPMPAPMEPAKK